MNSKKIAYIAPPGNGPAIAQEQATMFVALRVKIFGMYIGAPVVRESIIEPGQWLLDTIQARSIVDYANTFTTKPALTRLRDITPDHEDIFVDFAQALQTVQTINSNEDIERAVTAFSMAANRLRDLGYDCDGLIDGGMAIDLKLVTVN